MKTMVHSGHHAVLHIGTLESVFLSHAQNEPRSGPDVFFIEQDDFGIDEARTLKDMAIQSPVAGSHRVFFICVSSLTMQAQNALLKLFEEPPETARFYLIVPREDSIIPTLRSRLSFVRGTGESTIGTDGATFLQSTYADRLVAITQKMKAKDLNWSENVLHDIERWAEQTKDSVALHSVVFVRTRFFAPGASKKMLLEYLALRIQPSLSVTS